MSLRVWLPLNGTLDNYGCTYVDVVNNNTTINNNGKIGKCYEFGTNKYIKLVDYANEFLTYNEFSLSVWFKCTAQNTAHSGSALISGGSWNNADSLLQFSLGSFSTDHYTKLLVSGSGVWSNGYSYNFYLNTWYHVVLTSGNGAVRAYVNGQLIGDSYNAYKPTSLQQTWICIGNGTYSQIFHFIGLMNDVRIYDHCLSAAEVREISQGLVLHYKLDDITNSISNENLMPNSDTMALGSANPTTGTWRNAGTSNMTRARVLIENNIYGFQNSGIQTANDGSCYGIDNFPLKGNTLYRISMKARKIDGTGDAFAGFNIYAISQEVAGSHTKIDKNYRVTPLTNEWTECWYIVKTNANTKRNIYIGITTGDTSVTTQMCQVKIQEVYQFEDNNIIQDSSGYNHNGSYVNATITPSEARYSNCISCLGTTVDGSSNTITGAQFFYCNMDMPAMDAITISWWGKNTQYSRGGIFETSGSVQTDTTKGSDHGYTAIANWDTTFRIYNGSSSVNFFSNFNKDGSWHHHVITFDGTNAKYYCDNILKQTGALTGTLPAWKSFCMGLGKAGGVWRQIKQYVSDLRIYCTALDANAIRQLYEVGAKVDNKQNLHTFELIENNSKIQINKQGQTLCNELEEGTATKFYKTDEIIESNEFIEF